MYVRHPAEVPCDTLEVQRLVTLSDSRSAPRVQSRIIADRDLRQAADNVTIPGKNPVRSVQLRFFPSDVTLIDVAVISSEPFNRLAVSNLISHAPTTIRPVRVGLFKTGGR